MKEYDYRISITFILFFKRKNIAKLVCFLLKKRATKRYFLSSNKQTDNNEI